MLGFLGPPKKNDDSSRRMALSIAVLSPYRSVGGTVAGSAVRSKPDNPLTRGVYGTRNPIAAAAAVAARRATGRDVQKSKGRH